MTAEAFQSSAPPQSAAVDSSYDVGAVQPGGEISRKPLWPVAADVLADALGQTRPYAGDHEASDHAWAARVDAAVQGMDVVDSAGLDGWMSSHAAAEEPHLLEAELVAAWETHVRGLYAEDLPTAQDGAAPPAAVTTPLAIEAPERLAIEATARSYDDVAEDGAWEL